MAAPITPDHEAFLRHYTAHEQAVRAFVRMLVPGNADAGDVMQEVAIVLWRRFPEYDESRDFRGWAFGIAKMKVLAWQRDRGRERRVFSAETTELIADEAEKRADRALAQREALLRCLAKLPPEQRRLIDAAYAEGRRFNEVAQGLGQTVEATYKRLHRLRLALVQCTRTELSKEGWT